MFRLLQFLFLALVAVVGAIFLLLENPNQFKSEISSVVSANSPYELAIEGDLSWRYWPPLAIRAENVSLLSEGGEVRASFDRMEVDVDLVAVLTRQHLADINLIAIDGGTLNFREEAQISTPGKPNPDGPEQDPPPPPTIHELQLSNLVINYQGEAADYRLDIESLITSKLVIDTPFDFSTRFQVQDKDTSADIGASGSIIYQSTGRIRFDQVTATIETGDYPQASLVSSGEYHPARDVIVLNAFELRLDSLLASLTGLIQLGESPGIDGELNLESANLTSLTALTGLESPVRTLQLEAGMTASADQLSLTAIEGSFDASSFKGNLGLGFDEQSSVSGDLRIDKLSTGDYAPAQPSSDSPATSTASDDTEILPAELSEYHLDLILRVDELDYEDLALAGAKVEIDNNASRLQMIANAQIYGGKLVTTLDTTWGKTPTSIIRLSMDRLDASAISEIGLLTGTLTGNAELYFDGTHLSDVEQNLTGRSTYNITDGTIDVRPIKNLAAMIDAIRGKPSRISSWPDVMAIEAMTARHVFQDGTRRGQVLNAQLENLHLTALGGFNASAATVDYHVTAMFEKGDRGAFTVSDDIAGVRWPMQCQGSLTLPPADLCFGQQDAIADIIEEIVRQQLKQRGREKIDELIQDKVPQQLKDVTKKLLEGLFN